MTATPADPNEKFVEYLEAEKYRTESKYLQAIEIFEKILEKEPSETGVRLVLGDLLARSGDQARALETYYAAATSFLEAGQPSRAEDVLARVNVLDPDGKAVTTRKLRRAIAPTPPSAVWSTPAADAADDDGVSIRLDAPLFRDLSPQARSRLVERMTVLNVKEGSVIYREGDPGTSLYVISSGRVRMTFRVGKPDGTVEERLFAELGPGEFFGEFSFLTGSSRQFTARLTQDGRIFQLPKAGLEEVKRASPDVAEMLWRFYKERVLHRVLAGSSLFGGLEAGQRATVADLFQIECHPAGAVLIAEGSPGDVLYLIRSGDVRVTATGPSGDEVFLTNLRSNDFFGEFSFLTGRPRSASVVATSDVELLSVSRGALEPHLSRHPQILKTMKRAYFERMADNLHKLASA